MNQNDFYFYFSKSYLLSEYTLKFLIWRAFDARPATFPPFRQFEVLVSCEAVCNIFNPF